MWLTQVSIYVVKCMWKAVLSLCVFSKWVSIRKLLSHTITQGLSWLKFPDQYLAYLTQPWKQIEGGLAIVVCRSLIQVLSTDIESSQWYTTLIGAFIRASPRFLVSVFQVAVPCHLSLLNTDKVITAAIEHCLTGGVKIHVKKPIRQFDEINFCRNGEDFSRVCSRVRFHRLH